MRPGRAVLFVLLAAAALACSDAPLEPTPPNLLLIISDDQGYGDFGFMGSKVVQTPNIDRLAAEGTVFPMAHATSSLCKPTLTTLLTGYYPYQWNTMLERRGAPQWPQPGEHAVVSLSRRLTAERELIGQLSTLPRRLGGAGYVSFEGGKFSHGGFRESGFDRGMTRDKQSKFSLSGGTGARLGRSTMRPIFRFMRESGETPFFAWFAPKLPHLPFDAPEKHVQKYAGLGLSNEAIGYYANCSFLDERVGQLVERLERQGKRQDTLVVLISDNGWQVPEPGTPVNMLGGPKGKGSLYALGFRTPIIFNWPGHIEGGQVIDELASAVDIVPTLVDYAGGPAATDLPGTSLRPWIEGRSGELRSRLIGSTSFDRGEDGERVVAEAYYVSTKDWYFIRHAERALPLLFDMRSDPQQDHDVAAAHPDLVRGFDADIARWRAELESGLPEITEPPG